MIVQLGRTNHIKLIGLAGCSLTSREAVASVIFQVNAGYRHTVDRDIAHAEAVGNGPAQDRSLAYIHRTAAGNRTAIYNIGSNLIVLFGILFHRNGDRDILRYMINRPAIAVHIALLDSIHLQTAHMIALWRRPAHGTAFAVVNNLLTVGRTQIDGRCHNMLARQINIRNNTLTYHLEGVCCRNIAQRIAVAIRLCVIIIHQLAVKIDADNPVVWRHAPSNSYIRAIRHAAGFVDRTAVFH